MRIDKYYLLILLLINTQFIHAQTYTSINYSVNQGLPSNEVYQAYQDKEGFIWFGTDNGVVKFDGEEMQLISSRDGLSDPVVFGFQEDESGKLWLRTYSGMLSYIENGKITKYPYNEKLVPVIGRSLMNFRYSESTGKLHFMVRKGQGTIDKTGTLVFDSLKRLAFHYNEDHNIWILNWFDVGTPTAVFGEKVFDLELQTSQFFSAYSGEARAIKRENDILFSIKNHLFQYTGKNVVLRHVGRSPIISLHTDHANNLWVGYLNSGFDRFTHDGLPNPIRLPELENLSITSVLQDLNGGYWITTLEKGVFYYPNFFIQNHTLSDNAKILQVNSNKDYAIIGTQQGSILLIDTKTNQEAARKNLESAIHSLSLDPTNNRIWVYSGDRNLLILDDQLNVIKSNYANAVTIISVTNDGVWIQGGSKLQKLNKEGEFENEFFLDGLYRTLHVTNSDFIFGGRVGVEIISKDFSKKTTPEYFKNIKAKQITTLNDTLFLINTLGNGLMVANKHFDVLQTFNKENHFVADNIYSTIMSDTLVLVGTEEGLMIIKKKSLITGKPDYLQWSEQDGLIDNIIRFIALGHQSIWAFTDNGYSIIPLNQLFRTKVKPKGYIKKLEVNDSLTQLNTRLSLPHNQTKLTIHIGFLSFNNKVLKIRYRLNPLNPWIISKDRILQFSSIAPGDYNLEVEYSIDNVNWHPTNITFPFNVKFAWWLRWYSIVASIGIILIAALLIFKRRLNIQKKQNELLQMINKQQTELVHAEVIISEKERKRLSKELHDSIGTQLTAIKLNVVNILNNRNQPDDLKKIDTHLQHTIDEVRSMAYSLTPPEIERYGLFTALNNHFDKITQTSGIRVDFSTYGDDIQTNELSISIFRILQELSSNTLKHTKAKNIKVAINSFEQTVNILYEDDGGGFSPEKVKNGLGLSNITSRVGAIGGASNFESTAFGVSYVFEFPKNGL